MVRFLVNGRRVEINNPHESQRLGIGFVHQELRCVPMLRLLKT